MLSGPGHHNSARWTVSFLLPDLLPTLEGEAHSLKFKGIREAGQWQYPQGPGVVPAGPRAAVLGSVESVTPRPQRGMLSMQKAVTLSGPACHPSQSSEPQRRIGSLSLTAPCQPVPLSCSGWLGLCPLPRAFQLRGSEELPKLSGLISVAAFLLKATAG